MGIYFLCGSFSFAQSKEDLDAGKHQGKPVVRPEVGKGIDVLLEEANRFYVEEKYEQAGKIYEKILSGDPENTVALFYIKRIPEKIKQREVFKSNQEKQVKYQQAALLYSKAVDLYAAKEFLRARDLFNEVENILPNYEKTNDYRKRMPWDIRQKEKEDKIEELKKKKQEQEKLLNRYKEAVFLYQKEDYKAALKKFKELYDENPSYKNVFVYMHRISKKLDRTRIEFLLEKAKVLYENKQYVEARDLFLKVLDLEPMNPSVSIYMERLPGVIQNQEKFQLRQKAQILYRQAISLYRDRQYKQMVEELQNIRFVFPGYKKTDYYIKRALEKIKQEETEKFTREVELTYKLSLALFKKEKWELSLEKFKEVESKIYDYKNTSRYIEQALEKIKKNEETTQAREIESLYKQAVILYKNQEWSAALDRLQEVAKQEEHYRNTDMYIKRVKKYLEIERQALKSNKLQEQVLSDEAESRYMEARRLYKEKKFHAALEEFKSLDLFYPNYKDTFILTQRISRSLKETKINALFKRAEILYKNGQYFEAQTIYEAILEFDSKNKAARAYLENIYVRQKKEEACRLTEEAENIYKQAVALYHDGNTKDALKKFKEINDSIPEYKKTGYYLRRIPRDIFMEREK